LDPSKTDINKTITLRWRVFFSSNTHLCSLVHGLVRWRILSSNINSTSLRKHILVSVSNIKI
jgi:hypothetical protein